MPHWFGYSGHGVQVVAETPGSLEQVDGIAWTEVVGLRQGWGATFRGRVNASCWFHQPVTAMNLWEHSSVKCGEFYLQFDAQGSARVTMVHLWSGGKRIGRWDNLSLSGQQTYSQLFTPELALPGAGLNICTHVQFGGQASKIVFLGGYARYVTP